MLATSELGVCSVHPCSSTAPRGTWQWVLCRRPSVIYSHPCALPACSGPASSVRCRLMPYTGPTPSPSEPVRSHLEADVLVQLGR
jgi:hypothetical protein